MSRAHALGLAATAGGLLVTGAIPALADAPVKGGAYAGTTSQGRPVTGRVTSDGKRLQLRFADVLSCDDGRKVRGQSRYVRQAPTIKADGTIAYFKRYTHQPANSVFPHGTKQLQRVTGSFAAAGRSARIRVAQSVIGYRGGPTCKEVVTFTLRLRG